MPKQVRCIRCLRNCGDKDRFCIDCGAPLVNSCTNRGGLTGEPCKKVNDREALFCISCGSPTLFQRYGLLSPSPYPEIQLEDEDLEELKLFQHPFFGDG